MRVGRRRNIAEREDNNIKKRFCTAEAGKWSKAIESSSRLPFPLQYYK